MSKPGGPEYRYTVRSYGGRARAIVWEWTVYGPDQSTPLESGEVTGSQQMAATAGRAAVERLVAKAKAET